MPTLESSHKNLPEESHSNSHKYYPATKKDHECEPRLHNYSDRSNEGMDTHTTSSRYVPAGKGLLSKRIPR